jgi:hypothetical protein
MPTLNQATAPATSSPPRDEAAPELSSPEAGKRLAGAGPNEIPELAERPLRRLLRKFA